MKIYFNLKNMKYIVVIVFTLFFISCGNNSEKLNKIQAELDSIKNYAIRNGLTNITVHTCDYDIEKYYTFYTPYMNLICDDILLNSFSVFNTMQPDITYNITHKFISTNWRYTKARNFIALYTCRMPIHLSWSFACDLVTLQDGLWFDLDKWDDCPQYQRIIQNLEHLNTIVPVSLDRNPPRRVITGKYDYRYPEDNYFSPENKLHNHLEKYYRDAFVAIVTESRFAQPTGNYSEKTFQAMLHRKPFILVAPPKTLQYIKEDGFKTFSDFWDESYDDCLNHEDRLLKIFDLIDWVNNKSLEELIVMYRGMRSIMNYNFAMLILKTPVKRIQLLETA